MRRPLALALALAAAACGTGATPSAPLEGGCRNCHGGRESAAPPRALDGATDVASIGVGAHQAHVLGAALGRPVACSECHLVPASAGDPGHTDTPLPAEVVFGPLSTSSAARPSWDRGALRCAGTYCHGGTMEGGSVPAPQWTKVDGTQAACGACHGLPPPAPHPASRACNLCHAPVAGAELTLAMPLRHADGVLDVRPDAACGTCHGSDTNPAPPKDLAGGSDTRRRTVGAHQSHLGGGVLSRPVKCEECHLVPAELNSPGHVDTSTPAELSFGALASADGAQPSWDRATAKCANNYCHGATLEGGPLVAAPVWTVVDGTEAACGNCHGLPPPAPHPASDRCELCHLPTAGPNRTIGNEETHVDGVLQVATDDCKGCHGSLGSLAPPVDTKGQADPSAMGVGAHQAHLGGSRDARPVACNECHQVPSASDSPGHVDSPLPAEVVFGGVAVADNAHPRFGHDDGKCANTYCHGSTLQGGTVTTPTWNVIDGSERRCGACHGLPPPAPHPASAECQTCHAPTAGPGRSIANPATHIDGVVQAANGDCGSCHGTAQSSAPPPDTHANVDPSNAGVGAHAAHLGATLGISRPVACDECHLVPVDRDSPGHVDSELPAEITFGALARSGGSGPGYDPVGHSCSNTYCHGATLRGGSVRAPIWTQVDGSQASCGACHGAPPSAPHPNDDRCELCHLPTAGPGQTIADARTHIDGQLQVAAGCDSCHGANGSSAPPKDLDGREDPSVLTVGAHQAHLSGGASGKAVACSECHLVPAELGSPGHTDTPRPAELSFGSLANAGGHVSRYTTPSCSDSYCHAGAGAATPSPVWNRVDGSQASCGGCHAIPPATPVHTGQTECTGCHLPTAGPGRTIANRATHVDGVLQVTSLDCTSCHGGGASSAPPKDLGMDVAPTDPQVGAHTAHLSGGASSAPVACASCHVVPATVDAPGHLDANLPAEVRFSGLASAMTSRPTWSGASLRCSNTYCHGAQSSLGTNTTPTWNAPGSAPCGSCHGLPPAAPHPASDQCDACHGPTAGPARTIANAATHVDGIVQVTSSDCARCHGGNGDPAPPRDTLGGSDTSARGVGAHASHLGAPLGIARPVECAECHRVPSLLNDPGHIDTALPAEVALGALSAMDGATPSYDPATQSCSTYCHGSTLPDGANPTPQWTRVDGSQAACGACHGNPPGAPHPSDVRCELCHLPTAGPNQTIANPATHIDGVLQSAAGCDSCHGGGGSSAPPNDLDGRSDTSLSTVGAHRAHLGGGVASRAVACVECHLVPTETDSPGHVDTPRPAELSFGALSRQGGHAPSYAGGGCASTYCHAGLGAATPTPSWTRVDGSQASCGGCHAIPPATPVHRNQTECTGCHLPTAGPGRTIASRDTHVDGVVQVTSLTCTTCHGGGASSAPPRDLDMDVAPVDPQVGAHAVHLGGGAVSTPVACSECHLVPALVDSPGHIDSMRPAEVVFGGRASANLAQPTYSSATHTCAGTYCHGDSSSLGTNPDPAWNAPGSSGCGSCHGLPPAAPHPQVDKCEVCHADAGPNHTIVDRTRHVDGRVDVNELVPCQRCHGTAMSAAPPPDLDGAASSPTVGAHARHLAGTSNSRAVACGECHTTVSPATPGQAGHYDTARPAELHFGALARTGGRSPSLSAGRCSNTYCHGAGIPGATNASPLWTQGAQTCTSCHGMPPPDAVHGNGSATRCEGCHPDTAGPNQTIRNAAKHVDGVVDTSESCDACHGSGGNSAPPRDLAGANTGPKVGSHRAHLSPTLGAPVACADCHRVPATYAAPGHADTPQPAEVALVGRAALDGATPSYATANETCSNTYCHGATLAGGASSVRFDDTGGAQRACTACHGMPPSTPAHNGQTPNGCVNCHAEVAGAGQTIANRALHVDGVLQASGGGCDSCHGSPPAPGRESYAGSAGAHAQHAGAQGFACATCHGNDGSGPQHNQGNGTVSRGNVNIVFDPSVSYPGGTTMRNGQANAVYSAGSKSCQVGCHNPIVNNPNETPSLSNAVTWAGGPQSCLSCHDGVATSVPRNHAIAGQGDAACTTCHDMTGHMGGTRRLRDPDPNDAIAASSPDNQCKTCHDGTGGTAFNNQTARNVMATYPTSSHGAEGYACTECHSPHSAIASGPLFLDRASSSCMASGCHDALTTAFGQVPNGPISHHRIEGAAGVAINCSDCHNAHVSRASPNAAVSPDNRWTIYAMPDTARTRKRNQGDYRAFCLACHDGTPPPGVTGALNIQTALNGGTDPSAFKIGNTSQHRDHHNGYNCQNCHTWHGNSGTGGTNRGRMLYSYMSVTQFPYARKGSCSTNPGGAGFGFSCH